MGQRCVLDNVSLILPAGQIHAVVGENGAGRVNAREDSRQDWFVRTREES